MLFSFAIIIIFGLFINKLFEKIKIPGILGMLLLGIVTGPFVFDFINEDFLNLSEELRKIALIIILLRAGFGINKSTLQKVGKTAFKMAFLPNFIEGFSIIVLSMLLFNLSFLEGGILGFIIAAVSPAVVVPSMLKLIKQKKGEEKGIPTMILAGASIDDIVSITIFTTFLGLYTGNNVNITYKIFEIPFSILLGIILGVIIGFVFNFLFKKHHMRDTKKVLIIIAFAIIMTSLEDILKNHIQIASLLGIMTMAFVLLEKRPNVAIRLGNKFEKLWVFAEIMLFVLVGAQVNINVALDSGLKGLVLIFAAMVFRALGVKLALLKSGYNKGEKIFSIFSYIPKATVQAAIGAIPLSYGIESGDLILALAVLSIIVTASIGAFGIKYFGEKYL